jgi:hypothetical protein
LARRPSLASAHDGVKESDLVDGDFAFFHSGATMPHLAR